MSLLAFRPTPSTYQLRWFAGLWFPAFCGVIGGIASRQGAGRVGALIWLVGVLLGVAGLARPRIIRPVYTVLLRLTFPVGWLVSHLILAAVYFLAITPFGRLVGLFHDPSCVETTFCASSASKSPTIAASPFEAP